MGEGKQPSQSSLTQTTLVLAPGLETSSMPLGSYPPVCPVWPSLPLYTTAHPPTPIARIAGLAATVQRLGAARQAGVSSDSLSRHMPQSRQGTHAKN